MLRWTHQGEGATKKIYHVNLLRKWYSDSRFCFFLLQDECASEVPPGKTPQVDQSADVAFIPREEDNVFVEHWKVQSHLDYLTSLQLSKMM